jgi:peptidoglycan hydrolase CwlO-like protein
MEIEKKLIARVRKNVDAEISELRSLFFKVLKPDIHSVYLDLSGAKFGERVILTDLFNEIVCQREEDMYAAAGAKEVADFIKKVDSMQDQISGLYSEIESMNEE